MDDTKLKAMVETVGGRFIEEPGWPDAVLIDREALFNLMRGIDKGIWSPISTLPSDMGKIILAITEDGRLMLWRAAVLKAALRPSTPRHLQFPAILWRERPTPPAGIKYVD